MLNSAKPPPSHLYRVMLETCGLSAHHLQNNNIGLDNEVELAQDQPINFGSKKCTFWENSNKDPNSDSQIECLNTNIDAQLFCILFHDGT